MGNVGAFRRCDTKVVTSIPPKFAQDHKSIIEMLAI
jgi:hypothetical protein